MHRFSLAAAAAAALAGVIALSAAACGGDDGQDHTATMGSMMAPAPEGAIVVQLVNWGVEPSKTSAPAGKITFHAVHDMGHMHGMNEGGNIHDLQVSRRNADGTLELVGQVQGLRMGDAKDLTLDLPPGDYELQCNVVEEIGGKMVGHYTKGMHTPFKVT